MIFPELILKGGSSLQRLVRGQLLFCGGQVAFMAEGKVKYKSKTEPSFKSSFRHFDWKKDTLSLVSLLLITSVAVCEPETVDLAVQHRHSA